MSNETRKAHKRRLANGYFDKYLKGNGIDIGCGKDVLEIVSGNVLPFDKIHCDQSHDAEYMGGIQDNHFDFTYSSNCLEHLDKPDVAIQSWIRITKPGGIILFTVPDETLYEHDRWPSRFHKGHKWSFTMKPESKLPKSIFLPLWIEQFDVDTISMEVVDTNYDYSLGHGIDQTKNGAEAFIEVILRKKDK